VQVAVPAPQTTGRLFTVCSNVTKFVSVLALRKAILCATCLYLDCNVAEGFNRKISWDFAILGKMMRNRGKFLIGVASDGDRNFLNPNLTLL
jgi:hypothetical protein